MAGFQDDPLVPGAGCYSEPLLADEVSGLETDGSCFGFSTTTGTTSFSSSGDSNNSPRMLCFGDYTTKTGQRSGPACTSSAPVPSTNKTKISTLPTSNNKRDGSGSEWNQNPGVNAGAPTGNQRNSKRPKSDNASAIGAHPKVAKKEKLGERITALQQLVSPFGKTDTASVLHEALGYINFLQDQVKVLCSPYLQRSPPSTELHNPVNGETKEIERADELRIRGLCLVPVELTLHVAADSNGADLWSSAAMVNNDSLNC